MINRSASFLIASALFFASASIAQTPVVNISQGRHPNLAAAQQLTREAWEKIIAAQKANEFKLGGHAERAKQLLTQASNEIKLAADESNAHHR